MLWKGCWVGRVVIRRGFNGWTPGVQSIDRPIGLFIHASAAHARMVRGGDAGERQMFSCPCCLCIQVSSDPNRYRAKKGFLFFSSDETYRVRRREGKKEAVRVASKTIPVLRSLLQPFSFTKLRHGTDGGHRRGRAAFWRGIDGCRIRL